MLLDFFQFYSSECEEDVPTGDYNDTDMTQKCGNSQTTRDDLLRQLSQYESTPLCILFPNCYSSRKKDDFSSDEEDLDELSHLQLIKYPTFDEVVRFVFTCTVVSRDA